MKNKLIAKSLLIWISITPLAILNGALRQLVLIPALGRSLAFPISGILLSLCIFAVSYLFIPRLGKAPKAAYVKMGLVWVAATIVFETIVSIFEGLSFGEMLQAYNILTGDLWLLIVIFIGFVPRIVARLRKLA